MRKSAENFLYFSISIDDIITKEYHRYQFWKEFVLESSAGRRLRKIGRVGGRVTPGIK